MTTPPHAPWSGATASGTLDTAVADLHGVRAAVGRALDVDWVSKAAQAYGGAVDDVLAALDDAARLLGLAVAAARTAEVAASVGTGLR